jgi:pimeloyl-ACP methyl ester carboxylesterase
MKTIRIIILGIALTVISANGFAQNSDAFKVKVTGKGKQAILFIPGFACDGDVWSSTRTLLEVNYTCYTFTMAGFAGMPPQASPTFKGWEDAIASYIVQHKIVKPIIVGHSMGGALALAIASVHPDLLGKIVVVDALPALAAMMDPSFKPKENNDCSAMVAQYMAIPNGQFYKMQLMAMSGMVADTSKIKMIAQWSAASDRKTFAQMYCDFMNTDQRESIATIKCPALILLESNFANFKPAMADQYKNLKTAQLQYATKGLHFIMYDDFDWYKSQLLNFIK